MKIPLICLLAVCGCCCFAHGQSQGEMNRSSKVEFDKADSQLNLVYRKIVSGMKEGDDKAGFVAAQRAWLSYRDKQAAFEADYVARGGTMRALVFNATCTRLTQKRIQEIRDSVSVR